MTVNRNRCVDVEAVVKAGGRAASLSNLHADH